MGKTFKENRDKYKDKKQKVKKNIKGKSPYTKTFIEDVNWNDQNN